MRATKVAIAKALRTDAEVSELVPVTSVYAVERATLPTLPAVEVIGLSSERVGDGPMVQHELSVEVTVSHQSEDGADELLDAVVRAVRQRIGAAERQLRPIALRRVRACCARSRGHAGVSARPIRRASYGARRSRSASRSANRGPVRASHAVGPSGELPGRELVTFFYRR